MELSLVHEDSCLSQNKHYNQHGPPNEQNNDTRKETNKQITIVHIHVNRCTVHVYRDIVYHVHVCVHLFNVEAHKHFPATLSCVVLGQISEVQWFRG